MTIEARLHRAHGALTTLTLEPYLRRTGLAVRDLRVEIAGKCPIHRILTGSIAKSGQFEPGRGASK